MRHKVSTTKFKYGRDANRMLLKKLIRNFVLRGTIQTTEQKAKFMRSAVDRMITHAKKDSEASKNALLRLLGDKKLVSTVKTQVSPVFKARTSGFTTLIRVGERDSDGARIVKVSWVEPVVLESKEERAKSKEKLEEPKKVKKVKVTTKVKKSKKNA